eukprot:68737_1
MGLKPSTQNETRYLYCCHCTIVTNEDGVVIYSPSDMRDKIPLRSSIADYMECPVFASRGMIRQHTFALPSGGQNEETLQSRIHTIMNNAQQISQTRSKKSDHMIGNNALLEEPLVPNDVRGKHEIRRRTFKS